MIPSVCGNNKGCIQKLADRIIHWTHTMVINVRSISVFLRISQPRALGLLTQRNSRKIGRSRMKNVFINCAETSTRYMPGKQAEENQWRVYDEFHEDDFIVPLSPPGSP